RTSTETGSRQPSGKTAPIREPFEGIADRAPVDHAGADAADRSAQIEQPEGIGDRVDDPRNRDENAGTADHSTRTNLVDQVAFDRHQPGLRKTKNGEADLNC